MRSRLSRIALGIAAATLVGACAIPDEPFPSQPPGFEEELDRMNDEAEQGMREMLEENERLFDGFYEDDSIPMTGLGG